MLLEWHICGKGFVFNKKEIEADRKVALEGFKIAEEKVLSNLFDLVILDEITYLPSFGWLDAGEIERLREDVPDEVQPLVRELNQFIDAWRNHLQRSRQALGNLVRLKCPS